MNIFAGMCSKPMATKAEIGNQMPTILPTMSWTWPHRKTAMHTIQLQQMPLMVVMRKLLLFFFSATLIASCAVRPSFISQYSMSSAKITLPSKFPIPETAKVLGMLI